AGVPPAESVLVLDAKTGKEVYRFAGFDGRIYGVSFSPDGRLLAAAGRQGAVKVWDLDIASQSKHLSPADLSDAALIHTLRGHRKSVTSMAFSSTTGIWRRPAMTKRSSSGISRRVRKPPLSGDTPITFRESLLAPTAPTWPR